MTCATSTENSTADGSDTDVRIVLRAALKLTEIPDGLSDEEAQAWVMEHFGKVSIANFERAVDVLEYTQLCIEG